MSADVVGLRRRLAAFKPLNSSPVSDLQVVHPEEGHGGKDYEAEENTPEEVCSESMSQSSSSDSSHSGQSAEDGYEFASPTGDASGNGANDSVAEEKSSQVPIHSKNVDAARRNLPRVTTDLPRLSPRTMRRGTTGFRNVKHGLDNVSSSTSSWLGYDLSIIVAIVSPIGNLLTGSDHIKNILLILLLIYYLHQLVEVPWSLYRMSIPSEEFLAPLPNDADPTKLAAYAELRSLELFYLVLTVLSPFLGATLLRYVATSISGNPNTLSWFSTSLFVLATGMRPWTHLTERLKDRSRALTALLESTEGKEMSPDNEDPKAEIDREISEFRGKFESVDKRLSDIDASNIREWDDLADAIDAIEATVRRYQAEASKKSQDCEARIGVLETYVLDLHRKDIQTRIHSNGSYMRGTRLRAIFWDFLALPWTVSALMWVFTSKLVERLAKEIVPRRPRPVMDKLANPNRSKFRPPALETIAEEDINSQNRAPAGDFLASDSSQTLVMETVQHRGDTIDGVLNVALQLSTLAFSPMLFVIRTILYFLDIPRSLFRAGVQ